MAFSVVALLATGCNPLHGAHAQAGPSVGYTFGHGVSGGWEAGLGSVGLARVSVGGSYRDAHRTPETEVPSEMDVPATGLESIHYVVFEPIAGTLGAGFSGHRGWGFVGGFWIGGFVGVEGDGSEVFTWDLDCPDRLKAYPFVSIAVGVRYIGGAWEIYGTPKVGLVGCVEYAS